MKTLALFGLLGSFVLVAAGCAGVAREGQSLAVPVSPQVWHRVDLYGVGARFISPSRLAFLTSGSPSCPPAPYKLVVENAHSVRIDLTTGSRRRPAGSTCSLARVLSPVAVAIDPTQIDVHHRLRVSLYYFTGDAALVRPVVLTAPPL